MLKHFVTYKHMLTLYRWLRYQNKKNCFTRALMYTERYLQQLLGEETRVVAWRLTANVYFCLNLSCFSSPTAAYSCQISLNVTKK